MDERSRSSSRARSRVRILSRRWQVQGNCGRAWMRGGHESLGLAGKGRMRRDFAEAQPGTGGPLPRPHAFPYRREDGQQVCRDAMYFRVPRVYIKTTGSEGPRSPCSSRLHVRLVVSSLGCNSRWCAACPRATLTCACPRAPAPLRPHCVARAMIINECSWARGGQECLRYKHNH